MLLSPVTSFVWDNCVAFLNHHHHHHARLPVQSMIFAGIVDTILLRYSSNINSNRSVIVCRWHQAASAPGRQPRPLLGKYGESVETRDWPGELLTSFGRPNGSIYIRNQTGDCRSSASAQLVTVGVARSARRVKQRYVGVGRVSDDHTVCLSVPRDATTLVYEFAGVPADRRSTSGGKQVARRGAAQRVAR